MTNNENKNPERRDAHPYFIWDSIMSTSKVLEECLSDEVLNQVNHVAENCKSRGVDNIYLLGTESSSFAAMAEKFAFEAIANLPAEAYLTTEFFSYTPLRINNKTAVFFHSHSGSTLGDLETVSKVRSMGGYTVGVTNIFNSKLAETVDDVIIGSGRPKIELPATWTYASAIFRMLQLVAELGKEPKAGRFLQDLVRIPNILEEISLIYAKRAAGIVNEIKDCSAFVLIGSGPNFSTAEEAGLSLTQSSGVSAQAYMLENYLHGPIQALRPEMGVILIAAPGPMQNRIIDVAKACKIIGAKVVILAPKSIASEESCDVLIEFPADIPELLTPLVYILPLWQIAYYYSLLGKTRCHTDRLSMDSPEFKKAFALLMAGDNKFVKED